MLPNKKYSLLLLPVVLFSMAATAQQPAKLTGSWMDIKKKTKVTITQNGNSLTYVTNFGRTYKGILSGNELVMSFRYKSIDELPSRLSVRVRETILKDSILLKGRVERTAIGTEKLAMTINSPVYDNNTGERKRDSLINFELIRNPIQLEDKNGNLVTLVSDVSKPYPVIEMDNVSASQIRISGNKATIQISGKINDALSDLIKENNLKIKEAIVGYLDPESDEEGMDEIKLRVSATGGGTKDYWRPYPFEGTFTGTITIPVWEGTINVSVKATNLAGNTGFDSFSFLVTSQMQVSSVENNQGTDAGYFKPLMIKIYDPAPPSVESGIEDIQVMNGKKLPLEATPDRITGSFRSEVPVIALDTQVRADVPNILYGLLPDPASKLKYGQFDTDFYWSYTTHSPPNYFRYAAGTWVEHEVRSAMFRTWEATDVECQRLKNGRWDTEYDIDATIVAPLAAANGLEPGYKVLLRMKSFAGLDPQKQLAFDLKERNGNKERAQSPIGAFYVMHRPKIILVTVDGLGYQSISEALSNMTTPIAATFQKIFGGSINADKPALSAIPTITWCNWPGIFSVQPPKDHGVIGNAFFEREKIGEEPFATPNNKIDNFSATTGGLMDHSKTTSGSLYDRLAIAFNPNGSFYVSSIHQWYHKSSPARVHKTVEYYPGSTIEVFDQMGHSTASAKLLDKITSRRAPAAFCERESLVDIMAVYFPGPDNIAHAIGDKAPTSSSAGYRQGPFMPNDVNPIHAVKEHLVKVTDRYFNKLVEVIESRGYLYGTLFALTADHSLHSFHNTKEYNITLDNGMEAFLESLDLDVYTGRFIDMKEVVFAPNGGMAHIYLNSNDEWQKPPSNTLIEKVAAALYIEATGGVAKDPFSPATVNYKNAIGYNIAYKNMGPKFNDYFRTQATDFGSLGTPPALFVKICEDRSCYTGDSPNGFKSSFRWVRFVDARGKLVLASVDDFLLARRNALKPDGTPAYPNFDWPEFQLRLEEMNDTNATGSRTGDIVFFPDGYAGYMAINDGDELNGWHGGASQSESFVPLFFNIPGNVVDKDFIRDAVETVYGNVSSRGQYLRNWEMGKVIEEIIRNLSRHD